MHKQKIIGYLQSFVAIPMLAVAMPLTGLTSVTSPIVVPIQDVVTETSVITTQEDEAVLKKQGEAIDTLLRAYNSPLKGYGLKFAIEADKNDIDWRLLAAISGRESTFGIHKCKKVPNSVFGYGSCKMSFNSIDESIEIVSRSLGGNNPNTAHHYNGKTTEQILKKYNSVIPNYSKEVIKIMKMIDGDGEV